MIRYRQSSHANHDDFDIEIGEHQILDQKIERMSISKQEIDIDVTGILNRFQVPLNDEEIEHANPGISFLWSDERGRRSKMHDNVSMI